LIHKANGIIAVPARPQVCPWAGDELISIIATTMSCLNIFICIGYVM
jgi:hypothetical protein